MLRKKHLTKEVIDENRQAIADYLGLEYDVVRPTMVPGSYTVDITSNYTAQEIFKKSYPYGNSIPPGRFDFSKPLNIQWTGSKVMPA